MKAIFLLLIGLVFTPAYSQEKGSFTDPRDNKTYKTVKINNLVWMAENLGFKPEGDSWCPGGKVQNCDKMGRLYRWDMAKKVCPSGWRLPAKEEFEALIETAKKGGAKACNSLDASGPLGFISQYAGSYGDSASTGKLKYWDYQNAAYFWSSTEGKNTYSWLMGSDIKKKFAMVFSDYREDAISVRCVQVK